MKYYQFWFNYVPLEIIKQAFMKINYNIFDLFINLAQVTKLYYLFIHILT